MTIEVTAALVPAFDFDAPPARRETWSTRWERYGRDVIPLWVADTDFRAPPAVLRALQARLDHGLLRYAEPPPQLREAIVERLARLYGWKIEPDWIVFLPGVVSGLHQAARTLTPAGGRILAPRPAYQHLFRAADYAQRPRTDLPLVLERGRWVFDTDVLGRATAGATALFLCNPHNPGGTVFTREELLRIAEAARGLVLVSDEIHADLVLDPGKRHVPIASLAPEIGRRAVTLMSPNKAFNIPAAGCAWAIVEDPGLRRAFAADFDLHVLPGASVLGHAAALATFGEDAWLAAQRAYLRGNAELVEREIGALPGLSMAHVEATYLAWIDCAGLGAGDPQRRFLEHGVALSPGAQFGDSRFVRLSFGTQRVLLDEALARMRAALAGG